MGVIKKPKNALHYLKKHPHSNSICLHCYEAKDRFRYKSNLKDHLSGASCKNSIVRKGSGPSKEYEVNEMVKTKKSALAYMLQLAPNSRYTNVSGLKDTRKCKEKDCEAMLRVRKSSRFCKLKGDKVEIVSGYVIIGALEHNHRD